MMKYWLFMATLFAALPVHSMDRKGSIDRFIKSQEIIRDSGSPAENRTEDRQFRKVLRGTVDVGANGKKRDVLAVYYILSEYNLYHGYLALYDLKSRRFLGPLVVDGKGFRSAELKQVKGDVCFETKSYAQDDALAIPSIPGESCFGLDERGFLFESYERLQAKAGVSEDK